MTEEFLVITDQVGDWVSPPLTKEEIKKILKVYARLYDEGDFEAFLQKKGFKLDPNEAEFPAVYVWFDTEQDVAVERKIDGKTIDVEDTDANKEDFGYIGPLAGFLKL